MAALATRMAFGQELIEIAKTRTDFVVCNADTKTCGLEKFGQLFPGREFSFGIAEQTLVGGAAGLAFASMRACEQVRTFVCYPNLNVTIIGTHAGLQVGGDGATHAAIEDVSIMRSFPNMTIVQPAGSVYAPIVPVCRKESMAGMTVSLAQLNSSSSRIPSVSPCSTFLVTPAMISDMVNSVY